MATTMTQTKFGPLNTQHGFVRGNDTRDYNQIYDEDEYGDEWGENARAWKVYNDESDRTDAEMVDGWKGTLDTLLIFAGLFSAVVATFVIQTTQNLQPNYTEVSAALLTEIASFQRVVNTGGNASAVPRSSLTHDSVFVPQARDIWLNGIWLVSLALTLSTALITGMIKQWLHFYVTNATGTPKQRASIRQFRYAGLSIWAVPLIIELLPILMNASLLLFFVGLALFAEGLAVTTSITAVVILVTCSLFLFYLGSSLVPIWKPQCPYKTSVSVIVSSSIRVAQIFAYDMLNTLRWAYTRLNSCIINAKATRDVELGPSSSQSSTRRTSIADSPLHEQPASRLPFLTRIMLELRRRTTTFESERVAVKGRQDLLLLDVVSEMVTDSTNPTVPDIALQAFAGLPEKAPESIPDHLGKSIKSILSNYFPFHPQSYQASGYPVPVIERFFRALVIVCGVTRWEDALAIERFVKSSDDHRVTALVCMLACQAEKGGRSSSPRSYFHITSGLVGGELIFGERILDQTSIEIQSLHPLTRNRIISAASLEGAAEVLSGLLSEYKAINDLVTNLSPDRSPTLQEEVMFQRIFTVNLKDQASQSPFISILPDLIPHFLSGNIFDKQTLQVVSHWLLVLDTSRSDPSAIDIHLLDKLVRFVQDMNSTPQAFVFFCSSITDKRPSSLQDKLLWSIKSFMESPSSVGCSALDGLDGLFQHFLTRKIDDIDLAFPSTKDDQRHTLLGLIKWMPLPEGQASSTPPIEDRVEKVANSSTGIVHGFSDSIITEEHLHELIGAIEMVFDDYPMPLPDPSFCELFAFSELSSPSRDIGPAGPRGQRFLSKRYWREKATSR